MESSTFVWGIINLWNKKFSEMLSCSEDVSSVFEKLTSKHVKLERFGSDYKKQTIPFSCFERSMIMVDYFMPHVFNSNVDSSLIDEFIRCSIFPFPYFKFGHQSNFSFLYSLVQEPKNREIQLSFVSFRGTLLKRCY